MYLFIMQELKWVMYPVIIPSVDHCFIFLSGHDSDVMKPICNVNNSKDSKDLFFRNLTMTTPVEHEILGAFM